MNAEICDFCGDFFTGNDYSHETIDGNQKRGKKKIKWKMKLILFAGSEEKSAESISFCLYCLRKMLKYILSADDGVFNRNAHECDKCKKFYLGYETRPMPKYLSWEKVYKICAIGFECEGTDKYCHFDHVDLCHDCIKEIIGSYIKVLPGKKRKCSNVREKIIEKKVLKPKIIRKKKKKKVSNSFRKLEFREE